MGRFIDKLKALLPDRLHTDMQYVWRFGRLRNRKDPKTFHELLIRKKLTDLPRFRELGKLSDKYGVREFVTSAGCEQTLIPLVAVYDDPDSIRPEELPASFVLKGTHGSGMNLIVRDKSQLDWEVVRATARRWLAMDYSRLYREAPYRAVPRRLVVEELLSGPSGEVPLDYKFFVLAGKVRLFEVDYSRFTHHAQAFFMPDGRRLAVHRGREAPDPVPQLPARLDDMVTIAERLGAGHEFIRVDLYEVNGRIYFGELTFYPMGALRLWQPVEFEYEMGEVWREGRAVGEQWVAADAT